MLTVPPRDRYVLLGDGGDGHFLKRETFHLLHPLVAVGAPSQLPLRVVQGPLRVVQGLGMECQLEELAAWADCQDGEVKRFWLPGEYSESIFGSQNTVWTIGESAS